MLDKTFVEALSVLAQKAASTQFLKITDSVGYVQTNGQAQIIDLPPERRAHVADSIDAICAFAKSNPDSSVWYNHEAVVCLTDDDDRRDKITLTLELSPQLNQILKWEEATKTKLSQRDAVILFRTLFRDCLARTGKLLESMKSMRSKGSADGQSTVGQGKASVDKRIDKEWSGVEQIPDDFELEIPVFKAKFFDTRVICVAIDADPVTESFTFIPIPGSASGAIEQAEVKIGESLREILGGEYSRLYYGAP